MVGNLLGRDVQAAASGAAASAFFLAFGQRAKKGTRPSFPLYTTVIYQKFFEEKIENFQIVLSHFQDKICPYNRRYFFRF